MPAPDPRAAQRVRALERPSSKLLTVYFLQSLLALVAMPLVFVPLYFRYHTLRYRFDEEGVGASWGILFRREVYLTYRRIQDIHVKRNVVERWLGLGTVEVQTASGSSDAELSIEGLVEYELVRDYLYSRMRGHERAEPAEPAAGEGEPDLVALLGAIRDELAGARAALERAEG